MGNLRPKTWLWLLFIGYCGMMLWLLLLHRVGAGPGVGQVNLQPLETVRRGAAAVTTASSRSTR